MTRPKWFCCVALLMALTALAFWWRETQQRRVAEFERDRLAQELTDRQALFRNARRLDPASTPKSEESGNAAAARRSIASAASTPSDDRAKAAVQSARKAAIAEALLTQRVRRLMNLEMNLRPKFQALGFSDELWNRFQILSLEKLDREEATRRGGRWAKTSEDVNAAIQAATVDTVAEMKALIGSDAYDELQRFQSERSDPARKTVESLSNRLMFSSYPLESWQTEKLAQILRPRQSATALGNEASGVHNDVSNDVLSILSPPQQQAWRRLQIEEQRLAEAAALTKRLESVKNAPKP